MKTPTDVGLSSAFPANFILDNYPCLSIFMDYSMKSNTNLSLLTIFLLALLPVYSQSSNGIKLLKTNPAPIQFSRKVKGPSGPSQYMLVMPSYHKTQIYNLQTNQITNLPDHKSIAGIPAEENSRKNKVERLRNQLTGKDWNYSNIDLIYYDANEAGYLIVRNTTYKNIPGNPVCTCGGQSRLIEKYQRYYCEQCRKYVPTNEYLSNKKVYIYYHFNLKNNQLLWSTQIPAGELGLGILGTNAQKKQIYFSDTAYVSKKHPNSSGTIHIQRLNLNTQTIDLNQTHKIPVRINSKFGSWSLTPYFSRDFSWLAFIEYDEAADRKTNAPHLKNPGPQAWFINVNNNSSFSVSIDVTTYGVAVDHINGYAVLASNQTGRVKLVNLKTGKISKTIQGPRTVAQAILSPDNAKLYIVNKSGITQYSWPSLKKTSSTAWQKVIPGLKQLLTAEKMRLTGDGKFALIGKMIKSKHGPWYSSHPEKGFHILSIQ